MDIRSDEDSEEDDGDSGDEDDDDDDDEGCTPWWQRKWPQRLLKEKETSWQLTR